MGTQTVDYLEVLAGLKTGRSGLIEGRLQQLECECSVLVAVGLEAIAEELIYSTNGIPQPGGPGAVMGLYLPGLVGPEHAEDAARAAMKLVASAGPERQGAVGVDTGMAVLENHDGQVFARGPVIEGARSLARRAGPREVMIGERAFAQSHLPRSLPAVTSGPFARVWRG